MPYEISVHFSGAFPMCEKPWKKIEITLIASTCYLHHMQPSNSWLQKKKDSYEILGVRRLIHLPQKGQ